MNYAGRMRRSTRHMVALLHRIDRYANNLEETKAVAFDTKARLPSTYSTVLQKAVAISSAPTREAAVRFRTNTNHDDPFRFRRQSDRLQQRTRTVNNLTKWLKTQFNRQHMIEWD